MMYLSIINKKDGSVKTFEFSYSSLSGETDTERKIGGFVFDSKNMWVKDEVLYFAESYYDEGCEAIFAAFDLRKQESCFFKKIEDAQVVLTEKASENGRVYVLVNPMAYKPLQRYVLDDVSMESLSVQELELPHEYLTYENSLYEREKYYLFTGDMQEPYVAMLFDNTSREEMNSGERSNMLAVYDCSIGKIVWRACIKMSAEYDISQMALK